MMKFPKQIPILIGAVVLGNLLFTSTFGSRNAQKLREDQDKLYGKRITETDLIASLEKEIEKEKAREAKK